MNGGNTTPMKILIYEASLSFLRGACNTRMLRMAVDDYMASMTTSSVVDAIVKSLECRKRVLELSVQLNLTNDPRLRTALRADEEGIATILVSIFNSESDEETVLRLEGDSAQYYLDVVQEALDRGFMMAQEHNRMALRIIRKLSERCDRLPSSLFIVGVNGRDEHPSFGGGYGDIYRASCGDQRVALKRMRYFIRGSDLRRIRLNFCREALIWKDLHHSHILPFLGIDRDTFPSSLCMVSPWMEHGTVMHYLKTHGYANVDKLLYEIAQGLEYLHSRNIVHGDLRGANVLIKEDWSACLADFGLSKVFSDDTLTTSTNRGGSLCWMAPELLEPSRFGLKFARTPATDVYAFGCVCFELYTGRPPFSSLPEPAALMRILDGKRPERQPGPPAMSDRLWQLVTEFWAQSPDTRPPTRSVVQKMVWLNPGPRTVSPLSNTQKAPSAPSTPVDPPRASPINVEADPTMLLDLTGQIQREGSFPQAHGAFADVWKGVWDRQPDRRVAIKVLRSRPDDPQMEIVMNKRLARELGVWKRLDHKNVLKLIGTVSDLGPYGSMVCPWLEQGSVSQYFERRRDLVAMTDRLQLLCEVADGLNYLHENLIVHGDLTGSNILIDDEGKAKICDFGLSSIVVEFCGTSSLTSCIGGAVRWADASLYILSADDSDEAAQEPPALTPRSDIYSFGSVTLEILSGRIPYFYIKTDAQVVIEIHKGNKPRRPVHSVTDAQWGFIQRCWAADAAERPDAEEVGRAMRALHHASLEFWRHAY